MVEPQHTRSRRPAAPPWWVALIPGLFNLVIGLIVLLEPHSSLVAVAIVLGIYLIIVSLFVIVVGTNKPATDWLLVTLGAIGVLAGLFVVFRPGSALHGVRIVLGIYLVIAGGANALAAWRENRLGGTVAAIMELVAGLILLFWPGLGLSAFALIVGIYLILRGAIEIWFALNARDARVAGAETRDRAAVGNRQESSG